MYRVCTERIYFMPSKIVKAEWSERARILQGRVESFRENPEIGP
jgi:hypothetical protein